MINNIFKILSELGLSLFESFPFIAGFIVGTFFQEYVINGVNGGKKNDK